MHYAQHGPADFSGKDANTLFIHVSKLSDETEFGIVMVSQDGLVRVRSLADDSVLKHAGLAVGDVILAVGEEEAYGSAERATTLLAGAPAGEFVLLVQRIPQQPTPFFSESGPMVAPRLATQDLPLPRVTSGSSGGKAPFRSSLLTQLIENLASTDAGVTHARSIR